MDWFLYDNGLRHERVKSKVKILYEMSWSGRSYIYQVDEWSHLNAQASLMQHTISG